MKITLNNPGESSQRRLYDILVEQAVVPLVISIMAVLVATLEWIFYLTKQNPHPLVWTAVAVAAIVFAIVKVHGAVRDAKRLNVGIAGEKSVAETLDALSGVTFTRFSGHGVR